MLFFHSLSSLLSFLRCLCGNALTKEKMQIPITEGKRKGAQEARGVNSLHLTCTDIHRSCGLSAVYMGSCLTHSPGDLYGLYLLPFLYREVILGSRAELLVWEAGGMGHGLYRSVRKIDLVWRSYHVMILPTTVKTGSIVTPLPPLLPTK